MFSGDRFLPLGESVVAGIECMEGSAIYLKSTGISLQKQITELIYSNQRAGPIKSVHNLIWIILLRTTGQNNLF